MSVALPEFTVDGAERHSQRISIRLDALADNYVAVMPLIREAINRNAHAVLGYASPGAFIKDRFGDALGKLGVELRREVVRELSTAGLSTRAIAPVVGVDKDTVRRDIQRGVFTPPVQNWTPEIVPDLSVDASTGEVYEAGDTVHGSPEATVTETHTVKIVTGLDGKDYNRSTPNTPRRRSLVDDAYTANTKLWEAIERIRTITADDRFNRNKADILAALQPSIDLALEVLNDL